MLGADTIGMHGDMLLSKPRDYESAKCMLKRMSDDWHRVITAVCIRYQGKELNVSVCSNVRFRAISEAEIEAYWATGEPQDKAGAYAIQGMGAQFVQYITGSYSGVMGLPLFETSELLTHLGFSPLLRREKCQKMLHVH